ncbi:hypothetical protein L210DRAFT_3504558 [Boletus edulis BED1]|uniref:Uncharacterized protein n=1 Tax=Boletus edulis BED1 TaxID=1328754 RepID=A0AAD4GDY3_BOLED|nr:hypothetical protein L210DRAFT_3504558 [Boletus edulis BED1]
MASERYRREKGVDKEESRHLDLIEGTAGLILTMLRTVIREPMSKGVWHAEEDYKREKLRERKVLTKKAVNTGLDQVDARDEHDYANDERGRQRKGLTSRLGHRQQGAQVEKEHQTNIVKKGKSKKAEMSQQRLPVNYARKDTMQGNMETIGDSSFDKLLLFYANAGSASNKTIAKLVYQDNKVVDLGRVPLKLAMKKPSHANNKGQNAVMGLVDETAQITKVFWP